LLVEVHQLFGFIRKMSVSFKSNVFDFQELEWIPASRLSAMADCRWCRQLTFFILWSTTPTWWYCSVCLKFRY